MNYLFMKKSFTLVALIFIFSFINQSFASSENLTFDFEKVKENASQGNADAQYNLGLMYNTGQGVKQNYSEAIKYYELAAAQELAQAQFALGEAYTTGHGVRKDFNKALKYYELAANQGLTRAQFALGGVYEIGIGVKQDYNKAKKYYLDACVNGSVLSCDSYKNLNLQSF